MKRFVKKSIVLLTIFNFNCFGQVVISNSVENDTIKIIDPIEFMPFSIERDSIYIEIPDTLGTDLTGLAVLKLYINENSVVEKMEIPRLLVKRNNEVVINYTQNLSKCKLSNHYPIMVQRYYPFLYEYMKTIRIVKMTENIPKLTIMNLMVRFK